ncbi:hypothetical protein [Nocardia sp. NBC_01327]|uniref:hypothetical protein n=1 Tax=Nocardia sp. NBC_01327 TaxID=2903593 RepID=UPI002E108E38|nr:hypothetical protein OG326_23850 [Nocardia sp. NBC_01327]
MPPRKKTDEVSEVPQGRFYDLQQELAGKRRGPYRLTADIEISMPTRGQIRRISQTDDYDEQLAILLGGHVAAVEELYEDRPLDEWAAFQTDLRAHFFGQGAAELPGGSEGS